MKNEQLELDFPPVRAQVLRTAEQYVTKDRAAEHGDMEDNFRCIAGYWSVHLGCDVTGSDVSIMMALLKMARIKSSARNIDNWIDGCGYLACGAEFSQE
tara:strand:+ start:425 stop:721 length:297 start_codon:yes stop_codon:yes gene_type:complete